MKKIILSFQFLVFCNVLQGQTTVPTPVQDFSSDPRATTRRNSFWTEFNIAGSLTKSSRWQYQLDYQYRRAADASFIKGGSTGNIFKESYQVVLRPWIHYWLVPGNVRLSLSPLGFWVTRTPAEEATLYPNADGVTTGQSVYPEFRICPQVSTFQNLGRVQFMQRYRYEFRFVGERRAADNNLSDFGKGFNFAPTDVGGQVAGWYGNNHYQRLRLQTRIQVPINHNKIIDKTFYVNAWNELFLSNGKHVKNDKILNQNRVVVLLGYRFNKDVPIKVEAGFTYQTLYNFNLNSPPNDPTITYQKANVENNMAYTIYVVFDEFHKLFKKKEKVEN